MLTLGFDPSRRRSGLVALVLAIAACAPVDNPLLLPAADAAEAPKPPPVVHGAFVGDAPTKAKLREQIDAFEGLAGKRLGLVQLFIATKDGFPKAACDEIRAGGAVPMLAISLPGAKLHEILAGSHDGTLRAFAAGAADWPGPVLVRWGWEMNGDHSWSGKQNGGEQAGPATYRRAWAHVRQQMAGAKNLQWVWCPDAWGMGPHEPWNDAGNYYPGHEQVDWLGVDGYGWAVSSHNDPLAIFNDEKLAGSLLSRFQQTGKPIIIAETGADRTDPRGPVWTERLWEQIGRYPGVRAICWFNRDQDGAHWRLEPGSALALSYRKAVASDHVWGPPATWRLEL